MYDCKLMEIRRAFFAGWMGCGALFFVVEGGGRMADDGRRGDGCRLAPGFVGGWLLGCRNSAKTVFQKSELASLKQRTFVKQRRFPPAKNQLPSCRVRRQAAHASRLVFQGGKGGWLLGSLGVNVGLSGLPGM